MNRFLVNIFMFVILSAVPIMAQVEDQTVPTVTAKIYPSHTGVSIGSDFSILAVYTIPSGTHLTENFLEVRLDEQLGFTTGLIQLTSGTFEEGEVVRRGTASLKLPVTVNETVKTGKLKLKGMVSYQICTEGKTAMCYPPKEIPFQVDLELLEKGAASVPHETGAQIAEGFAIAVNQGDLTLAQRLENALVHGVFFSFVIVFIGGFLTSLTPCVYPMIPITIGYIGGKSAGKGKSQGFILSLFYVAGLALIYSALGVMAAVTGSIFGSITQTPLVLGIVAGIIGIMGLSMLGLFDITIPSSFASRIQSGGPKKGFVGAVLMGMVAGLVAAPCAGPIIIVLLAFIATTGNISYGFGLMMVYALGMGMLFIALGTFSGLLTTLPQAGIWMEKVKKSFGVLMLGAALFIAKPIFPPPLFGFLLGLFLLMLGASMGALDRLGTETNQGARFRKAFGLLFVVIGIYMVVTLLPIPGRVVPQPSTGSGDSQPTQSIWRSDLSAALEEAKSSNKSVVMDFTAEWCAQCKELEHKTFSQAEVIQELQKFIPIRVDCTNARDAEVKKVQSEYGIKGLPTVLILDSEGFEMARVVSFLPPPAFIKFLNQQQH